ncbi:MAG: T9SS type A sorting domain-containing protein [Bacteroidales bacterium]|nr:T9SS type A sorting domain-containing protein [Bacteroidales bacterium]MCF8457437.1 T9SS type A sorting domain-containing protein [Bacteroidales bacterium]
MNANYNTGYCQTIKIKTQNIPQGIYMIRFTGKKNVFTRKIVVSG